MPIRQHHSAADLEFSLADERANAVMQQRIVFGIVVRTARKALGLSKRKVARLVGLKHIELSKIENFKANPNLDVQSKLCHALGIKVTYHLSGSPAVKPNDANRSLNLKKKA